MASSDHAASLSEEDRELLARSWIETMLQPRVCHHRIDENGNLFTMFPPNVEGPYTAFELRSAAVAEQGIRAKHGEPTPSELLLVKYQIRLFSVMREFQPKTYVHAQLTVLPEQLDQDAECPICREKYSENPTQRIVKAHDGIHDFHAECFERWLDSGSHTCPICRQTLRLSYRRRPGLNNDEGLSTDGQREFLDEHEFLDAPDPESDNETDYDADTDSDSGDSGYESDEGNHYFNFGMNSNAEIVHLGEFDVVDGERVARGMELALRLHA